MNLFKKIIYTILSLQEKILQHSLEKTLCAKQCTKRKKKYYNGYLIDFNSIADSDKEKLEEEIKQILKHCNYKPEELINYIQQHDTDVVIVKNADKYLNIIHENEGFILPSKGLKALYISLFALKKISLKTKEMFIISERNVNKYYFMYHFYNWFTFKHNIEGIDSESQALLNKYLCEDSDTKELQLSEIYKLKDAINQDMNAINFVINLCKNYDGAKNALNKMETEGGTKL